MGKSCFAILICFEIFILNIQAQEVNSKNDKQTIHAIKLAQEAHSLTEEPNLNNQQIINKNMQKITGALKIFGWKAKRINNDVFLVEYAYDRSFVSWDYDTRYIFEVNETQGIVRNIIGDYELEELYGLIDTKEKLYKTCYRSFKVNSAYFYQNSKLDVWGMVELYSSFLKIIQYNDINKISFESKKFFGLLRKPYIQALIKDFSDESEGNNKSMIYQKDFGNKITEYHSILMEVLNTALENADE